MVTTREERLQATFADLGLRSGSEFYIPASQGSTFLEGCCREELSVLGIEVFARVDDQWQPRLDLIADFSDILGEGLQWTSMVSESVREGTSFLDRLAGQEDLWLNFVLLSEEEFRGGGNG